MLSVVEYARKAGISPRAVRFRIADGSLEASKTGGRWVITEEPFGLGPQRQGRRLRAQHFDQLAAYLEGDGGSLSSDERRRCAERAVRLAMHGLDQVRVFAQRPDSEVKRFRAADGDLAELRGDERLNRTGISHPDAEVYGAVVDAYVAAADLRDIELFYLLEPAPRADANVVLRVQDPVPQVKRLHVIADLLDDRTARSHAAARRLFEELMKGWQ